MTFISDNKRSRIFKSTLLAVLALAVFAASASAQSANFSARDYALLANSHIAADFNGDGKVDLAATGLQLLVMLNNGDGTFAAPVSYTAGNNPQDLAAGDFNNDGRVDLVVTNNDSQVSFNVLLGNGDGTFGAAISSPNVTGLESPSVVAGDFDRDGTLDLAVAHPSGCYGASCITGRSVSLLRGNGDGTFQPSQQMDVGDGPTKLVVGDFNGDTISDLGVAAAAAKVFVLLGRGDGTFVQQPDLTLVNDFLADNTDIDAADFNRDGVQDLAVSSPSQGSRTFILLGVGDGTFRPPTVITDPDQQQPQYQAVADFNGDGLQDIALGLGVCCSTPADGFMNILFGNGDGTFQPAVHYLAPHANTSNSGGVVVASDFNGDGKPDIAMLITGASPRLTVLTNSAGVATPPPPAPLALSSVTATPSSVSGGTSATINVSLTQGAPRGGIKLTVSSSKSTVVTVPSSITIAAGASSAQFNAGTSRVTSTQTVTITVSSKQYGSRSATVTVTAPTPPPPPPAGAPTVLSVTLTPGTVTGGSAAQGTVNLSASVSAATVVSLASSNAAATVPASVTVAAGSSSATFTVGTTSVSASASATISATLNGTTRSATLTINPTATTTDTVAITLAQYDIAKRVLRVEATSSRSTATLQVFVTSSGQLLGTLTNNGGGKYGGQFSAATNPQSITISSSLGGSATRAVTAK
jgi:hypothetical protein